MYDLSALSPPLGPPPKQYKNITDMYIFIHVGSPWTLPIDVDMPFNLLAHAQVAIPKSEARRHICYMNGSVSFIC